MGKNAHLHIVIETDFLNQLKRQAKEKMITVSQLCRLKLQKSLQMDRIELKIDKLIKNGRK
jgi:hypothetical protein